MAAAHTTPLVGECGVLSGCTGSKPLTVITEAELDDLGSLHDVNLFVRLSALRRGLWCRECHQSFIDALSTGAQQPPPPPLPPPPPPLSEQQHQETGRKRDFAEISEAATEHQPPLQQPQGQTTLGHQLHQEQQQHAERQQPLDAAPPPAGTEQTRDLAARELAAMRGTPPEAAAAAASPPVSPPAEAVQAAGPRFTVTSPYPGPREIPPGLDLSALTSAAENGTGEVLAAATPAPAGPHAMYGAPTALPTAESVAPIGTVDVGGTAGTAECAGVAAVTVSTAAPVLATAAPWSCQAQEAGQQVLPAPAPATAAVVAAVVAAAAMEAAHQIPLPQHQPPPQLQAALQHHSATAPPHHLLLSPLPPPPPPHQQEQHDHLQQQQQTQPQQQQQPNQQNGGLPPHSSPQQKEAVSGAGAAPHPSGTAAVAGAAAHGESSPVPLGPVPSVVGGAPASPADTADAVGAAAHGLTAGVGGQVVYPQWMASMLSQQQQQQQHDDGRGGGARSAGQAAGPERSLKSRLADPRSMDSLGPSASTALAAAAPAPGEVGREGGGVDHAGGGGGVPIGHEFVDADGRVLPYPVHSVYMLGPPGGALPPGVSEGPGAATAPLSRFEEPHRQR